MSDSITPNKFYVYALYRPGCDDPFYIGKGCGSRIDGHENCAAKKNTCKHLTCRIIRKVWREGHEIRKEKIADGIPEHAIGVTPANVKTYPGFISPDGTLYENVFNLTQFAKDHGLHPPDLCRVASGQARHTKGWMRYPPLDPDPPKQTYSGPGFVSSDGTIYQNIQNLTEFCKEHDLSPGAMSNVAQGKRHIYKGWTVFNH